MKNDELKHYGILGMKWGVRRYQPYPKGKTGKFLGKLRRTKSQDDIQKAQVKKATKAEEQKVRTQNRAAKKEANKKTKPPSNAEKARKLSDAELREVVQRLQMEKRYVELTKSEKSRGQKMVEDFLYSSAEKTAKKFIDELLDNMGDFKSAKGGDKKQTKDNSKRTTNSSKAKGKSEYEKKKKTQKALN